MTTRPWIVPALLGSLLLAGPAMAQTTRATAATPAPAAKPAAPDRSKAAVERRITELRTRLKITPPQQKPFDDFAQVMRDNAQRMGELADKSQQSLATSTAVDQMRHYSDMAQAHAEDMQHLTTAFSTLYGALAPDQQKLADQSFRDFVKSRRGAAG